MATWYKVGFLMVCYLPAFSSAPSTYTIKSSSVCYGSDPDCTRHFLDCDEKTSVIGIFQGVYGFKPIGSFCREVSACSTVNPHACCTKQRGDCEVVFQRQDIELLYSNCSSKSTCSFNAPRLTAKCSTQSFRSISVFADVKYTCVKDTQIVPLGDRKTIVGDQVYVNYQPKLLEKNADLVECQCLIQSRNQTQIDLDVFALDIRLNATQESSCSSVMFIKGGEILRELSCRTRRFYHSFEYLLRTSTPLRAKVVISKRSLPKNIWFGFRGLNGEVTLSCSYVSQFIDQETVTSATSTKQWEITPVKLTSRPLSNLFIPSSTTSAPLTTKVTTQGVIAMAHPTGKVFIFSNPAANESKPLFNQTESTISSTHSTTISLETTTVLSVRQVDGFVGNVSSSTSKDRNQSHVTTRNNSTGDVVNSNGDDKDNLDENKGDLSRKIKTDNELNYNLEKATDKIYETVVVIGSIFGASAMLTSFVVAVYCYLNRRQRDKNEMSEIFQIEDDDRAGFHPYHVIDPSYVIKNDRDEQELTSQRPSERKNCENVENEYSHIGQQRGACATNVYATPHRIIDLDKLRHHDQFLSGKNDYFHLEADTSQSNSNDVISGYVSDDGYSHLNRHQIVPRTGNDYDSLTPGELKSTDL